MTDGFFWLHFPLVVVLKVCPENFFVSGKFHSFQSFIAICTKPAWISPKQLLYKKQLSSAFVHFSYRRKILFIPPLPRFLLSPAPRFPVSHSSIPSFPPSFIYSLIPSKDIPWNFLRFLNFQYWKKFTIRFGLFVAMLLFHVHFQIEFPIHDFPALKASSNTAMKMPVQNERIPMPEFFTAILTFEIFSE